MSGTGKYITFGGVRVNVLDETVDEVIRRTATARSQQQDERAFTVADLGEIIRRHRQWTQLLPRVQPVYAMKANMEPPVLRLMASLGVGFHCSSEGELKALLEADYGVTPSRIMDSNTCSPSSEIRYAARQGIQFMTCDTESQILKIKQDYPHASVLLRITPPVYSDHKMEAMSVSKFGCFSDVVPLLQLAKRLNVNIVGVCFHKVGEKVTAVNAAKHVFNLAKNEGFAFNVLNIGGTFDGRTNPTMSLKEHAQGLNRALDDLFPKELGVVIIAEPGQYYVMSAFALCSNILSMRVVNDNDKLTIMYYITDGVHGMFGFMPAHGYPPQIEPMHPDRFADCQRYSSVVWGPSHDYLDCVLRECFLPRLSCGDWVVFKDMGAYTFTVSSDFSLMPKPDIIYVVNKQYQNQLELND